MRPSFEEKDMKIYGRSLPSGFKGVVLDDDGKKLKECDHEHLTRSSAERCGKVLAEYLRRQDGKDQDPRRTG